MIRNSKNSEPSQPSKVQSVHRSLRLLKLITARGQVGVSEAAEEINVHPSTAQRLLATLVAEGFAAQDEQRRYAAGPELLSAGHLTKSVPLPVKLRPALERLYTRVRETVHIATLLGTEIHHIEGIRDNTHGLQFGGRVGVVLPAHNTSAGRAILAQLSRSELDKRYLSDPHNAAGITGLEGMAPIYQMAMKTREQGMGMNFGDSEEGVAAFGAFAGTIDGQHVALSIAMPSARFKEDLIPHFRASLRATVAEIQSEFSLASQ